MLILNKTYCSVASHPFPLGSIHRVIWLSRYENIAVLIRVDVKPLKSPIITTYSYVDDLVEREILQIKNVAFNPNHRLSDEKLAELYPPKNRKVNITTQEKPKISAAVEYRKFWLNAIDEITPNIEKVWRKEVSLLSLLKSVADSHSVPINATYQVLYKFWAAGSIRKSVISNRINCGGAGKSRVGKGYVLGRKQTQTKLKGLQNDNFKLDAKWLLNIKDTHKETIRNGVTAKSAYLTFLNLHCSTSCVIVDGVAKYKYLPKKARPSKTQFITNGPGDDPEQEAWRKQLADNEYEKNFRGLFGNSEPQTFATGNFADVDSTSNDQYLVSVFNCLVGVGTARTLPVVDVNTGYIFGGYVGWRVNTEAAKLAILNAASQKVEYCAHFGITITPDEWYACLCAKYRADRGEFHAEKPQESLRNLNRSIEFVMTGRPEYRGGGEQTHRRTHDHEPVESTRGRSRKRGEKDPAIAAHKNIFEYTREWIRLILYHNNYAPVPHLLTTEMKRCGVKATRKAILEWSMEMGYHHEVAYLEEDLILELCPEFEAVVTRDGVYPVVKRNSDTGDEILLKELRYLGPFIKEQRWLEQAPANKRFRIKIRINPNLPTKAWYLDVKTGLHELTLSSKDSELKRLVTVEDLVVSKTAERGGSA